MMSLDMKIRLVAAGVLVFVAVPLLWWGFAVSAAAMDYRAARRRRRMHEMERAMDADPRWKVFGEDDE